MIEIKQETLKMRLVCILLTIAIVFDGITQGIVTLQETMAKKVLFATDFEITLIGVLANATILLSFFITYYFANRSKKWLLFGGFLMGRFIFLGAFFIRSAPVFLIFLFFYQALFAVQLPVVNNFFPHFFKEKSGLAFGIFRSLLMVLMMATTLTVGKILDINPAFFTMILSFIALTGAVTYAIFFWLESKIDYSPLETHPAAQKIHFRESVAEIWNNKGFIIFEVIFMIYGLAFMILVPTVPLFMLKVLKLSYFEMAQAQGVYAQIFMILTIPFAGKIYDRIAIWKVGIFSMGILVFYPLFFLAANYTGLKILAFGGLLFYSLGLSGLTILWNLGCMHFSKGQNFFIYQGFHTSLTGVRGLIGPLVGYFLIRQFGFHVNFIVTALLFLAAAVGTVIMDRKSGVQARQIEDACP